MLKQELKQEREKNILKSGCGKEFLKNIIWPHSSMDTCLPAGREWRLTIKIENGLYYLCHKE